MQQYIQLTPYAFAKNLAIRGDLTRTDKYFKVCTLAEYKNLLPEDLVKTVEDFLIQRNPDGINMCKLIELGFHGVNTRHVLYVWDSSHILRQY